MRALMWENMEQLQDALGVQNKTLHLVHDS